MYGFKNPLFTWSSASMSFSRLSRFFMKLKAEDFIASEAVVTVGIEKMSGTRDSSRHKKVTRLGLLLIDKKHVNNELGFSLLEPSCLKLLINGFTAEKNRSQNSEPSSQSSYFLRTRSIIFRHKDLNSLNCFREVPAYTHKKCQNNVLFR